MYWSKNVAQMKDLGETVELTGLNRRYCSDCRAVYHSASLTAAFKSLKQNNDFLQWSSNHHEKIGKSKSTN